MFQKTEKPITPKSKELIVKYVYSDFHQNEDYLPKSLCARKSSIFFLIVVW